MSDTTAHEAPLGDADILWNTVVEGRLQGPHERGFLFDLQGGHTALVPREEFPPQGPSPAHDALPLLLEQQQGPYWSASWRKAEKLAVWQRLQDLVRTGEPVEGVILAETRGGLSVDIGLRARLPMSHIDLHRVDVLTPYLGLKTEFQVLQFDESKCEITVSRRKLLEHDAKSRRKTLVENLQPGAEFDGIVRTVTAFGAFVDIGGVEGLLHVSNMSWGRLENPAELVRPGDQVRVVLLEHDAARNRIALGRKQLLPDPWQALDAGLEEGATLSGKVVSLTDFGAFVEITPGLEGLVHITELSWTARIQHPRDVLALGQTLDVRVISVDQESRRLSLSVKQLEPSPWTGVAERLPLGTRLTGTVRNVTDFGVFVEIAPAIEGLVHVSDISWSERIESPKRLYSAGQNLEVVVLSVDADAERVSLGIKQLTQDPWELAESLARPGQKIDVAVTRVTDFGAFVQIAEGVEGLIHVSELREERVERVLDVVKPGQTVQALVLSFDAANQRIALSLKRDALPEADGEGEGREYSEDTAANATLGDLLRERLGLKAADDAPSTPSPTEETPLATLLAQAPSHEEPVPASEATDTEDVAGN